MIPVDKIVADDLAALAADSRRQPRSAQDALRAALGKARRDLAAAPAVRIDPQLAAVHAARGFAAWLARAVAGGVLLLCAIAVLVALHDPRFDRTPGTPPPWWAWPLRGNAGFIAALIAALAVGAHVAAGSLAGRWIEDRWRRAATGTGTGDIAAAGRPRIVRLLDAAAVALPVAGATCALLVVGVIAWTAGQDRCTTFWLDEPEAGSLFTDRLRDLTIAMPIAVVAALVLGRACARRARWVGWLGRGRPAWLGIALAMIATRIAVVHQLRPFSWSGGPELLASSSLRTAVTAIGALAALLFTAGLALGRRRRERCRRATAPGELPLAALPSSDGDLVSLAGALRSRVARAAAGGVAAMLAAGLTVALHNPRGARSTLEIWPPGSWARWLVTDPFTIVAVVAVVVLGAMPLAAALAHGSLARHLGRCPPDDRLHRLELARRLVRRLDGVSLGLAVAGGAAIVSLIAIVELTAGSDYWVFFTHHGPRVDGVLHHVRHEIIAAVAVSFTAGLALARAAACAHRARRLPLLARPAAIAAAAALGAITTLVWMRLDFGVSDISAAAADLPSTALQSGLTAALTGAVLVVASGLALCRRHREHDHTGLHTVAPGDASVAPGGER